MNTGNNQIEIGGMQVNTLRKNIKNVHLGVYPPTGRVRVAVPLNVNEDAVRLMVISRIPWIKKQLLQFNNQEREPKREFVSGESHYLFGSRHRLNVINIDSNPRIEINRKLFIDLFVKKDSSVQSKEKIFEEFRRKELRKKITPLLEKWQEKIGVSVNNIQIKKMKTKWGSCSSDKRNILINTELSKKPIHCIEYILVHEMIHLTEKKHSKNFIKLMDKYLPNWQQYREELNSSQLGYSAWNS